MFIVVIEADMTASQGFGGFFVVFDVVGLEAFVAVVDVHVIVSNKDVAAFLLRAPSIDFDIAGFAGVKADLLSVGNRQRRPDEKVKKSREEDKEPGRGRSPGMEMTIHVEHLCDENS